MVAFSEKWYYHVYPMRAYMITSGSKNSFCGMPAAWVTPLSMNPPLIGVAISKKRYTHRIVSSTGVFAVNSVGLIHHDKVMCAGTFSCSEKKNKLEECGFNVEFLEEFGGLPVLREAYSIVIARVTKVFETGDHDFFVGVVKKTLFRDGKLVSPRQLVFLEPLLHVGKKFFATVQKKIFYK